MKRRYWTEMETAWLIALYPDLPDADVSAALRRSSPGICNRAVKFGLHKSRAYKAMHCAQFRAGFTPWNKGLKGVNGVSATRFKNGNLPHNAYPVGAERKNKEGHLFVKISQPNSWVRKDALCYGVSKIPKGSFLRADGIVADRAKNMKLNTYHRYPKEIARLIQLRGALNRQINKRIRHVE